MSQNQSWVYMLQCADNTLYTGWTNDMEHRLEAHNAGLGAKYTQSRLPVTLVYIEEVENKSAALKRELRIKKLTRRQKLALIASQQSALQMMEKSQNNGIIVEKIQHTH